VSGRRRVRVACVDDNEEFTKLLRDRIGREPDLEYVGSRASADDLVPFAEGVAADVLVLDASMPGRDPFAALGDAAGALPQLRVLVFSGHDDPALIEQAIEAGAWGYVCKDAGMPGLLDAIRRVGSGEFVRPASW
jgi:DNA-binding NarL/FixJ family response regulator